MILCTMFFTSFAAPAQSYLHFDGSLKRFALTSSDDKIDSRRMGSSTIDEGHPEGELQFEGDMLLTPAQLQMLRPEEESQLPELEAPERRRAYIPNFKWPADSAGLVWVPWKLAPELYFWGGYSPFEGNVRRAQKHIEDNSCVRFKKRTIEPHYIYIRKGDGCRSQLGMKGGRQDLQMNFDCWQPGGILIHELMHALGFLHEQSRPDRDQYVHIRLNHVKSGEEHNFDLYPFSVTQGHPYDYDSIMHYRTNEFGKGNPQKQTIQAIGGTWSENAVNTFRIGQRRGLSHWDIKDLNKYYC